MFDVERLDGPMGVRILGLDFSKSQSDDTLRRFIRTFHEHQVVVVPDQRMELSDFDRMARSFGRPHALVSEQSSVPGQPHITFLSNAGERRDGSAYWHTDNTYEKEPASATALWAKKVPANGGATVVADMYGAYDSLPAAMQKRIDGMRTLNGWVKRDDNAFVSIPLPEVPEERKKELGVFAHPLVLTHPVTGRKALYSVTGSSFAIEGMPEDEGLDLLKELTTHAVQDKFQLNVRYQKCDVAAWDTLATLHSATAQPDPTGDPSLLREMYRISVKGLSPYAVPLGSSQLSGEPPLQSSTARGI